MTNEAWLVGLKRLVLAFPDRDMSEGYAQERGNLYRPHLDDLADAAWLHAVAEAVRHERWFPTVAALRDYTAGWTPTQPLLPGRTPEQIEADLAERRESARAGAAMLRAGLEARGLLPAGETLKPMPSERPEQARDPVMANTGDETRLAELRRQADEIAR